MGRLQGCPVFRGCRQMINAGHFAHQHWVRHFSLKRLLGCFLMDRPTQASSLRITESPELRYSLIQGKCGLDRVWQRANGQGLTYSCSLSSIITTTCMHIYIYIYAWVRMCSLYFPRPHFLMGHKDIICCFLADI